MRFGAVFQYRETYGAVRFGFEEDKNPTVRFGAVNRIKPHRTDRKNRTVKNPDGYAIDMIGTRSELYEHLIEVLILSLIA